MCIYFCVPAKTSLPHYRISTTNKHLDDQVTAYFNLLYSNVEILTSLLVIHGIKISLSTLKRILKRLNLRRRHVESTLTSILSKIFYELQGSGNSLGYRMMLQRLKLVHGLTVKRDTVMKLLRIIDPDGVNRRKGKRLVRRKYIVPGPSFMWHVDGYDKLKPFGFAIHACIDGFSRRFLWVEVAPSNKNSKVIANYFLDCVAHLKIVPRILRCDPGTENALLESLQPFFRRDSPDTLKGLNSFIYGSSTQNQRIESWWSKLRQLMTGFWMNFFKDLRDRNEFNDTDPIHVNCLRLCFMRVIRAELCRSVVEWNLHRIRVKKNAELIGGKPDVLFYTPQIVGRVSYGVSVDVQEVDACKRICEVDESIAVLGCSEPFRELVQTLRGEIPAPKTASEALELYRDLINDISKY